MFKKKQLYTFQRDKEFTVSGKFSKVNALRKEEEVFFPHFQQGELIFSFLICIYPYMGERKPALEMREEIVDSAFMKTEGKDCFASVGGAECLQEGYIAFVR